MAQLMHASSTGFLVVLSAEHVTAWQETPWCAVYGGLLGVVAAMFWRTTRDGSIWPLTRRRSAPIASIPS
jgi:hypothetical protein